MASCAVRSSVRVRLSVRRPKIVSERPNRWRIGAEFEKPWPVCLSDCRRSVVPERTNDPVTYSAPRTRPRKNLLSSIIPAGATLTHTFPLPSGCIWEIAQLAPIAHMIEPHVIVATILTPLSRNGAFTGARSDPALGLSSSYCTAS